MSSTAAPEAVGGEQIAWQTREVYVPTEQEALARDVELDFAGAVYQLNKTGPSAAHPHRLDYFISQYDSSVLTPEQADELEEPLHPMGDLVEWEVVGQKVIEPADPASPIGRINEIHLEASRTLAKLEEKIGGVGLDGAVEMDEESRELANLYRQDYRRDKTAFEREARTQLVEIFNDVGRRDNQERLIVDGHDFSGVNLRFLAAANLSALRADLSAHDRQCQNPWLYERAQELAGLKLEFRTPSNADRYLLSYFAGRTAQNPDSKTAPSKLPEGFIKLELDPAMIARLDDLLSRGAEGYRSLADIFYAGDMGKTYKNLSAAAKMTGQSMPEGWRQFLGTSLEARRQIEFLAVNDDFSKYVAVFYPDRKYLPKARINYRALRNMSGN